MGDLLRQLRAHAEAEVARRYLEPTSHRRGWVLSGDEVAGRLVWGEGRDVGEPYDVVVDGRTLSCNELGRALEPFEGWPFRLVIEDRSLDVRPDAEVITLPSQAEPSQLSAAETATAPERTIDEVLSEFLAAQEQRLAARTFTNYRVVVELLRACLNGYGHQHLDDDERVRFERAFNDGDEGAFAHLSRLLHGPQGHGGRGAAAGGGNGDEEAGQVDGGHRLRRRRVGARGGRAERERRP
ncbi:MAG: hypothetical protein M3P34_05570 [Actinomycetota bacterium]|nr:hypothetical protein [Actinomycetota bacterium]